MGPDATVSSEAGRELRIQYPELPPTENKIRQIRWGRVGGGRAKPLGMTYTKEADGYKLAFREYMRTQYFVDIQKFARGHTDTSVYSVTFIFNFPPAEVLNAGWLKKTKAGKRGAKTCYKRMDVGNRRKLLEDCLSAAIGIDDSLFFDLFLVKTCCPDSPGGVEIVVREESPSQYGIPSEYLDE